MTASQRAEQLGRGLAEMRNPANFIPIAGDLIRAKSDRIFSKGMGADGNPLPAYSTKPISIGKKATPRQSAKGKYEGGYAEFKAAIGRGGNTNLFLFGLLNSAYSTSIVPPLLSSGVIQFGTEVKEGKGNTAGKLEGIAKRYPTAFGTSESEKELVLSRFRSFIMRTFASS